MCVLVSLKPSLQSDDCSPVPNVCLETPAERRIWKQRDCNRVKVHEEQESNQKTHQSDEGEAQVQQAEKEQTECLNKDVNSQNRRR